MSNRLYYCPLNCGLLLNSLFYLHANDSDRQLQPTGAFIYTGKLKGIASLTRLLGMRARPGKVMQTNLITAGFTLT